MKIYIALGKATKAPPCQMLLKDSLKRWNIKLQKLFANSVKLVTFSILGVKLDIKFWCLFIFLILLKQFKLKIFINWSARSRVLKN